MSTRTSLITCALAALCLLALSASPATAGEGPSASGGIAWQTDGDIDAAIAAAAADDRVVMVDVYATWCGPCHALDRQTFPDDGVIELSKKLVAVKINGETEPGEALMDRYHVVAFPTVLFIGPDGNEIDRIVGFVPPEDFVDLAGGYLEGRGTLEDLEKQLADKPDDLELREDVFQRHVMRGNETQALEHANKLRALLADYTPASDDQPDRATRTAMIDYQLARYLYLRGADNHQTAHDLLVGIQTTYPDIGLAKSANYPLARALLKLGKEDEAFAALQRYIDADPESSGGYNTVAWFTFREKVRMEFGIEMARKGLALDPKNAGLQDTLAELLMATGDQEAALAAIDTAVELDPGEPYYKEQRQRFLARIGKQPGVLGVVDRDLTDGNALPPMDAETDDSGGSKVGTSGSKTATPADKKTR